MPDERAGLRQALWPHPSLAGRQPHELDARRVLLPLGGCVVCWQRTLFNVVRLGSCNPHLPTWRAVSLGPAAHPSRSPKRRSSLKRTLAAEVLAYLSHHHLNVVKPPSLEVGYKPFPRTKVVLTSSTAANQASTASFAFSCGGFGPCISVSSRACQSKRAFSKRDKSDCLSSWIARKLDSNFFTTKDVGNGSSELTSFVSTSTSTPRALAKQPKRFHPRICRNLTLDPRERRLSHAGRIGQLRLANSAPLSEACNVGANSHPGQYAASDVLGHVPCKRPTHASCPSSNLRDQDSLRLHPCYRALRFWSRTPGLLPVP